MKESWMGRVDGEGFVQVEVMVPGVVQQNGKAAAANGDLVGSFSTGGGGGGDILIGSASAEKKLRKRRELDAMVAKARMNNGGKHLHRTNGHLNGGMLLARGSGKTSSQELLADYVERGGGGGVDDDDDELVDVALHGSRGGGRGEEEETESSELGFDGNTSRRGKKTTVRKKSKKCSSSSTGDKNVRISQCASLLCRTCSGLWLVATVVCLCFMVVFAVLGLHVQMKMEVDTFRTELSQGCQKNTAFP